MSNTQSNVIEFPKQNKRYPDVTLLKEKMEEAIQDGSIRRAHAQETINLFTTILIENLAIAGFDVSKSADMKMLALAIESLKAYIMKYYGEYHPLQGLSEELFIAKKNGVYLLKTTSIQKFLELKTNSKTEH